MKYVFERDWDGRWVLVCYVETDDESGNPVLMQVGAKIYANTTEGIARAFALINGEALPEDTMKIEVA